MNRLLRNLFVLAFLIGSLYILILETRLYQSSSVTMVKNINESMPDLGGLGIFASASSTTVQDARILQSYLASYDELEHLDKLFHLYEHYHSDALDFADRLYSFNSREDFFRKYLSRLQVSLDEVTGLLSIGFLHTDANLSKAITEQLIKDADAKINENNKLIAKKRLFYIESQVKRSKKKLDESIRRLENFQNKYNLLDPSSSAQSSTAILSNLQAQLVSKKSELNTLKKYMSDQSFDVIRLKREIKEIEKTLKKIRIRLANNNKGQALNAILFEYERLKNFVDINREIYKAALLQLEQTKVDVSQNSKVLMKLTQPHLPDEYAYPEKTRSIFMLFLILSLSYGILALIHNIIREH